MAISAEPSPRGCVFLDRDGTLIVDRGYAYQPEQLQLLPHVREGLCALREAGLLLIVVTNQSGVARGLFEETAVLRFHEHLSQQLGAVAAPDAYYYCPFHPEAARTEYRCDSPLRKPAIGMYERACSEFAIARERSFMIGDKLIDMEFARRAGLRGIRVGCEGARRVDQHLCVSDFACATESVLAFQKRLRNDWGW